MGGVIDDIFRILAALFDEATRALPGTVRDPGNRTVASIVLGLWGVFRWVVALLLLSLLPSEAKRKYNNSLGVICFLLGMFAVYDWTAQANVSSFMRFVLAASGGALAAGAYKYLTQERQS
jgi:hypothetical protein